MPIQTYPNQRLINIHRERVSSDFLGIKNENWQAAARDLRPHTMMLYFYLASNRDGFSLALSPAAIRQAIGMARSTYHDQFQILVDKGYLVHNNGNNYDFYEKPQPRAVKQAVNRLSADGQPIENGTNDEQGCSVNDIDVLAQDTEINSKYSIYNNSINRADFEAVGDKKAEKHEFVF